MMTLRKRGLAAGVALAVLVLPQLAMASVVESGAAPITVTTTNNDFTAFAELGGWFASEFSAGRFDSLIAGNALPGNVASLCNCSFGTGLSGFQFDFAGTTGLGIAALFGSATGWLGGINYELSSYSGNDYTFKLLSYAVTVTTSKGTNTVISTVDSGPSRDISVPGPIAGAGLPAVLGLMGFGLYRSRARKAA